MPLGLPSLHAPLATAKVTCTVSRHSNGFLVPGPEAFSGLLIAWPHHRASPECQRMNAQRDPQPMRDGNWQIRTPVSLLLRQTVQKPATQSVGVCCEIELWPPTESACSLPHPLWSHILLPHSAFLIRLSNQLLIPTYFPQGLLLGKFKVKKAAPFQWPGVWEPHCGDFGQESKTIITEYLL